MNFKDFLRHPIKSIARWYRVKRMGPLLADQYEWLAEAIDLIREEDPALAAQTALEIRRRIERGPNDMQLVIDVTEMMITALNLESERLRRKSGGDA